MIVFNLSCDKAHLFEGWFGSADDFAAQTREGNVACPVCGSVEIARQPSAPYVNTRGEGQTEETQTISVASAVQLLRKKFIEYVVENTEDVGRRFPEEARRIFYNESPERAIRGTASKQEAIELKEEGIDVVAIADAPVPPEKLH